MRASLQPSDDGEALAAGPKNERKGQQDQKEDSKGKQAGSGSDDDKGQGAEEKDCGKEKIVDAFNDNAGEHFELAWAGGGAAAEEDGSA